jgi:hypothetical protein
VGDDIVALDLESLEWSEAHHTGDFRCGGGSGVGKEGKVWAIAAGFDGMGELYENALHVIVDGENPSTWTIDTKHMEGPAPVQKRLAPASCTWHGKLVDLVGPREGSKPEDRDESEEDWLLVWGGVSLECDLADLVAVRMS